MHSRPERLGRDPGCGIQPPDPNPKVIQHCTCLGFKPAWTFTERRREYGAGSALLHRPQDAVQDVASAFGRGQWLPRCQLGLSMTCMMLSFPIPLPVPHQFFCFLSCRPCPEPVVSLPHSCTENTGQISSGSDPYPSRPRPH